MSASRPRLIPPADPRAAYLAHRAAIDAAVQRVLASGWYILGREGEAFEREFASWLGARDVIGVANGTDAVELALRGCGIQPGDGVIAPAHTATATIAAIERAGAVPVLVDIEPVTFGLDPEKFRQTVSKYRDRSRLRAVVVVHLYGHPAAMDDILPVAREHGLVVVEDCAQAHGAAWRGRLVGTFGDAAAFSFYPTKNLAALGDGGAVATSDPAAAERVRMLRQYGWRERYSSEVAGMNSRLDEIQAAMLRVRLTALHEANRRRIDIAVRYAEAGRLAGLAVPRVLPEARHVFHQYAVLHEDRDAWRAVLESRGVGSAHLYPRAIPDQPAYAGRLEIGEGGCDVSRRVCRDVVCLPIYPELGEDDVLTVISALGTAHH